MPRIRTLKPEFWQDEKLSLLDPLTRLVFLGLISIADDAGRIIDNVKYIDGQLFPNTDDSSRDSLDTLARLARITRYRAESGQSIMQIQGWSSHQKVDHPSKYVLPGPEEAVVVQPRESLAKPSRSDLGPSTVDLRPTTGDRGPVAGSDPVSQFVTDNDFGPFGQSVEGLVRSSKRPHAVLATLRMHLQGEMGHEPATPRELGLAAQQFAANGQDFNARYFSGFVKNAKQGVMVLENRRRNAAEERHIGDEQARRDADAEHERAARDLLASFEENSPERFAELRAAAEKAVPAKLTFGREQLVRAQLLRLVRENAA
jgi:hypothetical protein